jgi:hypothetical protein
MEKKKIKKFLMNLIRLLELKRPILKLLQKKEPLKILKSQLVLMLDSLL